MGIDAGERRLGIALSDELRMLASPLKVLDRVHGLAPVLDALIEITRREGVARLVVGLPLNADGSEGRQAKRARDFARVAERVVGVPVEMWDERLSTQAAEAIVRAQGRNTKRLRQRGEIDAIAAAVILQDYLDHATATPPQRGTDTLDATPPQRGTGTPTLETDAADARQTALGTDLPA
jgi:putative holliday junction resolvase